MTNGFSELAIDYDRRALVQRHLGERLLNLLDIHKTDDILDVGCGTGYFTRRLAERTQGLVTGCDASEKMIAIAQAQAGKESPIQFTHCAIESLQAQNEYDVIFCNASLEWFEHPDLALLNCFRALRPRGIMAIQTLLRSCRIFSSVIKELRESEETKAIFQYFKPPWHYGGTLENCEEWIASFGFKLEFSEMEQFTLPTTFDEANEIFSASERAAYLNPNCYSIALSEEYVFQVNQLIQKALTKYMDPNGLIPLSFVSGYFIVQRP